MDGCKSSPPFYQTDCGRTRRISAARDYYAPELERSIRWDDPTIGIDWGLGNDQPVLSDKDAVAPLLAGFDSPFIWEDEK